MKTNVLKANCQIWGSQWLLAPTQDCARNEMHSDAKRFIDREVR